MSIDDREKLVGCLFFLSYIANLLYGGFAITLAVAIFLILIGMLLKTILRMNINRPLYFIAWVSVIIFMNIYGITEKIIESAGSGLANKNSSKSGVVIKLIQPLGESNLYRHFR